MLNLLDRPAVQILKLIPGIVSFFGHYLVLGTCSVDYMYSVECISTLHNYYPS